MPKRVSRQAAKNRKDAKKKLPLRLGVLARALSPSRSHWFSRKILKSAIRNPQSEAFTD
jgi:hypothetical protein